MCDLGVSVRNRDAMAGIGVVLEMVAVVRRGHAAQILFWGFLIVGLHWPAGVCWVRRIVLWQGPERSRKGLDCLVDRRAAHWMNEAAFDNGISTEANKRFVLHDREIDTPTLSSECQQPSHQSAIRMSRPSRLAATGQNPASTSIRSRHGDPLCITGFRRSDILVTL